MILWLCVIMNKCFHHGYTSDSSAITGWQFLSVVRAVSTNIGNDWGDWGIFVWIIMADGKDGSDGNRFWTFWMYGCTWLDNPLKNPCTLFVTPVKASGMLNCTGNQFVCWIQLPTKSQTPRLRIKFYYIEDYTY